MNEAIEQRLPSRVVDAHVHLWDLQRLHMPWIGPPLNRDFLIGDYRQAAAGLNIGRAVYVEVGVGAEQRYEEAEIAIEHCRRPDNPLAGVVMSGDVAYGHFLRYLEALPSRRWIKGVRQGLPAEVSPTSAFVRGVRRLGELDVAFELNGELPRALALVELCPQTRFVLDHCGGATFEMLADERQMDQWARLIDRMARHGNVACKLSGISSTAPAGKWRPTDFAPVVAQLLRSFGPSRLMFAGDWPICTLGGSLAKWLHAVAQLVSDVDRADRSDIFQGTATRWYGLEETDK